MVTVVWSEASSLFLRLPFDLWSTIAKINVTLSVSAGPGGRHLQAAIREWACGVVESQSLSSGDE